MNYNKLKGLVKSSASLTLHETIEKREGRVPVNTVPTKPVPLKSVPVNTVPTKSVSTKTVPVNTVPTKSVPTKTVPVNTVPIKTVPVNTVPIKSVPVNTVPTKTVPVNTVPTKSVPVNTVPTKSVPTNLVPTLQKPVNKEIVSVNTNILDRKVLIKSVEIDNSIDMELLASMTNEDKLMYLVQRGWRLSTELRGNQLYDYATKYIQRKKQRIYLSKSG